MPRPSSPRDGNAGAAVPPPPDGSAHRESTPAAAARAPTVVVVDDDDGFRASTVRFLRSVGYDVESYAAPEELLSQPPSGGPTCILLDLRMPGMSGLEAQHALMLRQDRHPIVFMSGHADAAVSIQAMKRGAVDFLLKPFEEQAVLDAIDRALRQDAHALAASTAQQEARARLARLTAREHQVCEYLMQGMLNKQIAAALGIAESTVKVHRSRMMEKLGVGSLVALTRLMDQAAGAPPAAGATGPRDGTDD
ncbi:MAG TPA: response regulator [Anaeromyxobacteraceae bacterium]|nr:response regulator [Anaeromyxobacteraceae bacterium]